MNMKTAVVGILVLTICMVAGVTASTMVGNIGITPSSDLISGETKVSVSFVVDFAASGGETFGNQDTLSYVHRPHRRPLDAGADHRRG